MKAKPPPPKEDDVPIKQNLDGRCPICYIAFLIVSHDKGAMFCPHCGGFWERPGFTFTAVRAKTEKDGSRESTDG